MKKTAHVPGQIKLRQNRMRARKREGKSRNSCANILERVPREKTDNDKKVMIRNINKFNKILLYYREKFDIKSIIKIIIITNTYVYKKCMKYERK